EETEQEIRSHVPYPFVTQRFSPGYGDLPLHTQPILLRMLDAGRTLGITATAQHILLPQKSVTAVLGCSHSPVQDARKGICGVNCKGCPQEDTCPSRCSTAEN
ncbi:MAG: 5-methyltetrahydrofolate--homocysteine methyltransferase, partial [Oscillospiraceae bacterium]|nr:5-methyltetrahydrofolate--homocysteine methyltransferase [Oscillospiraceae bacterium]